MDNAYSTEIREVFGKKYLKVFMLDDSVAGELKDLLGKLKEIKSISVTESQSKAHPGETLTIYPKPMVNIETLEKVVKKVLDSHNSGVVEVKTETISEVEFKDIEQKILNALDEARATIDVSMAWFTNTTLQNKLLEKQNDGCKVRIMVDANYTNEKHGVDLSPFEHKAVKAERKGIMHYKFCVIDNNVTIHGSYNWTTNTETKNNEEVSVHINDVDVASQYTKEFNRIWDKN